MKNIIYNTLIIHPYQPVMAQSVFTGKCPVSARPVRAQDGVAVGYRFQEAVNVFRIKFPGDGITHISLPITGDDNRHLFLLFSLIRLSATFSGFPVRDVAFTLAGFREERFIGLNYPVQGIKITCSSRSQEAMTTFEGGCQIDPGTLS